MTFDEMMQLSGSGVRFSWDFLEDGGQRVLVLSHAFDQTDFEVLQIQPGLLNAFCPELPLLFYSSLKLLHFLDQISQLSHLNVLLLCPLAAFPGHKFDLVLEMMNINLQVAFGLFVDRVLAHFALLVLRELEDDIPQGGFLFLHGLNFSLPVQHVLFFSHKFRFMLHDELLLFFEVLGELTFFEDTLQ